MRTIKFRAKPCYMNGNQPTWVYGTFQYIAQRRVRPGATDNGTLEPRNDKGRIVDLYGTETEVLCDTVGQYTGLHDRKDREIYEGDIIECVSWNEYWTDGSGKPMERMRRRMLVWYENGAFVCLEHQDAPFYDKVWSMITNQDCIIVGNRFDNPDLWPWSPFEGCKVLK